MVDQVDIRSLNGNTDLSEWATEKTLIDLASKVERSGEDIESIKDTLRLISTTLNDRFKPILNKIAGEVETSNRKSSTSLLQSALNDDGGSGAGSGAGSRAGSDPKRSAWYQFFEQWSPKAKKALLTAKTYGKDFLNVLDAYTDSYKAGLVQVGDGIHGFHNFAKTMVETGISLSQFSKISRESAISLNAMGLSKFTETVNGLQAKYEKAGMTNDQLGELTVKYADYLKSIGQLHKVRDIGYANQMTLITESAMRYSRVLGVTAAQFQDMMKSERTSQDIAVRAFMTRSDKDIGEAQLKLLPATLQGMVKEFMVVGRERFGASKSAESLQQAGVYNQLLPVIEGISNLVSRGGTDAEMSALLVQYAEAAKGLTKQVETEGTALNAMVRTSGLNNEYILLQLLQDIMVANQNYDVAAKTPIAGDEATKTTAAFGNLGAQIENLVVKSVANASVDNLLELFNQIPGVITSAVKAIELVSGKIMTELLDLSKKIPDLTEMIETMVNSPSIQYLASMYHFWEDLPGVIQLALAAGSLGALKLVWGAFLKDWFVALGGRIAATEAGAVAITALRLLGSMIPQVGAALAAAAIAYMGYSYLTDDTNRAKVSDNKYRPIINYDPKVNWDEINADQRKFITGTIFETMRNEYNRAQESGTPERQLTFDISLDGRNVIIDSHSGEGYDKYVIPHRTEEGESQLPVFQDRPSQHIEELINPHKKNQNTPEENKPSGWDGNIKKPQEKSEQSDKSSRPPDLSDNTKYEPLDMSEFKPDYKKDLAQIIGLLTTMNRKLDNVVNQYTWG